jgi:hypothetical protein
MATSYQNARIFFNNKISLGVNRIYSFGGYNRRDGEAAQRRVMVVVKEMYHIYPMINPLITRDH